MGVVVLVAGSIACAPPDGGISLGDRVEGPRAGRLVGSSGRFRGTSTSRTRRRERRASSPPLVARQGRRSTALRSSGTHMAWRRRPVDVERLLRCRPEDPHDPLAAILLHPPSVTTSGASTIDGPRIPDQWIHHASRHQGEGLAEQPGDSSLRRREPGVSVNGGHRTNPVSHRGGVGQGWASVRDKRPSASGRIGRCDGWRSG
jgi:hypothetical protein